MKEQKLDWDEFALVLLILYVIYRSLSGSFETSWWG